jgi:hypothetical protein
MRLYRIQQKRLELVRDWLAHFSKNGRYGEGQSWQRNNQTKGKRRRR